jgi:hypothetical protein
LKSKRIAEAAPKVATSDPRTHHICFGAGLQSVGKLSVLVDASSPVGGNDILQIYLNNGDRPFAQRH